jgi:uncharacterized protein (DUF427 family)
MPFDGDCDAVKACDHAKRRIHIEEKREVRCMPTAEWKSQSIAESEETIVVEGNHYFPPNSVHWEYLVESDRHTVCPWKGRANYYDIIVGGERNPDAAWTYPKPSKAAKKIEGYVAFWKGVKVHS